VGGGGGGVCWLGGGGGGGGGGGVERARERERGVAILSVAGVAPGSWILGISGMEACDYRLKGV